MIVKCGWLECKIDYRSILPSNHFPKKKKKKKKSTKPRERERPVTFTQRESETKSPIVKKREAGYLNLRSTAPPSRPCLSPITDR